MIVGMMKMIEKQPLNPEQRMFLYTVGMVLIGILVGAYMIFTLAK